MNKMTLKAEGNTLILERVFPAPRKLVFQAFTDGEMLKHWWGPRGWELTASRMDFRPGGSWHYCMKCMDQAQGDFFGMESWGKTVYEEVVDGEKFTGTDYFSDAEGIENRDMPPARIMLLFEDVEGGTKVTNHSVYASAEALKSVIDMGMEQGVTETWDRLEEYVAAAAKA